MAALRVNRTAFGRACWTDVQFTRLTLSLNPANTVVCWLPSCPHKVDVDTWLSYISIRFIQARSQKFAMGGAVLGVWGRSPQPLEANGGLGAKPPAAEGWGFGGIAPSRRRHGGLGAMPPALENFAFFCKNNFILGLFWLNYNTFKTWLRNWQCKQN